MDRLRLARVLRHILVQWPTVDPVHDQARVRLASDPNAIRAISHAREGEASTLFQPRRDRADPSEHRTIGVMVEPDRFVTRGCSDSEHHRGGPGIQQGLARAVSRRFATAQPWIDQHATARLAEVGVDVA